MPALWDEMAGPRSHGGTRFGWQSEGADLLRQWGRQRAGDYRQNESQGCRHREQMCCLCILAKMTTVGLEVVTLSIKSDWAIICTRCFSNTVHFFPQLFNIGILSLILERTLALSEETCPVLYSTSIGWAWGLILALSAFKDYILTTVRAFNYILK